MLIQFEFLDLAYSSFIIQTMLNLVIMAVGLIGAVTIVKGVDWSIEISPEEAADSLFELHSFCD